MYIFRKPHGRVLFITENNIIRRPDGSFAYIIKDNFVCSYKSGIEIWRIDYPFIYNSRSGTIDYVVRDNEMIDFRTKHFLGYITNEKWVWNDKDATKASVIDITEAREE